MYRIDMLSQWIDVQPVVRPTLIEAREWCDAHGDLADCAVITDERCRVVEQRLRTGGRTWIRFYGPRLY